MGRKEQKGRWKEEYRRQRKPGKKYRHPKRWKRQVRQRML